MQHHMELTSCSSANNSEFDSSAEGHENELKQWRHVLSDECAICLGLYDIGDEVTALSCLHVFHLSCIAKWIVGQDKHHCPICRWPSFIERRQLYSVLAASHNEF